MDHVGGTHDGDGGEVGLDACKRHRTARGALGAPAAARTPRDSALFEAFYRETLRPCMPGGDAEWADLMETLRGELPTTFRFAGGSEEARFAQECFVRDFLPAMARARVAEGDAQEERPLPQPRPIAWYPEQMAWEIDVPRWMVRRAPVLGNFHRFLVDEAESGSISRQEAVSMVPVLLLDVQPEHRVLDMCAAPGSKTAQLLEALHARNDAMPPGVVVANDAHHKRCYLLVHQCKRLRSPCLVVVNHDASMLPTLHLREAGASAPLKFDRVLCDVPCSSDGTLRKNPAMWATWTPMNGVSMFRLQTRIAERGVQMLAVGGRLVYSTCSMHPCENEAVVAHLLRKFAGALDLVDVSSQLVGLRRCPGLTTWRLMDRHGKWLASDAAMRADRATPPAVCAALFPPSPDELHVFHLERWCAWPRVRARHR